MNNPLTELGDLNPEEVFNNAVITAVKLPGARINREEFLRASFKTKVDEKTLQKIIDTSPEKAGVSIRVIDEASEGSIKFETAKVTALSAAAGAPGGLAVAATIPADLAQYVVHAMRISQKLAYLYGWPDFFDENTSEIDEATKNMLILFMGVMFGAGVANEAIGKIAEQMAKQVAKKLPQKALTKGVVYPVVKKVAAFIGVKMTKDVFAKGVSKIVPLIGAAVSGGITLGTYYPMAKKLEKYLQTTPLADSTIYSSSSIEIDPEFIDVDDKEPDAVIEQKGQLNEDI